MFKGFNNFVKEELESNTTQYQWEKATISSIAIEPSRLINTFQKLSGYTTIEYKDWGLATWFHPETGYYVLDETDNQYLQFATLLLWISYHDGEDLINCYLKGDSEVNEIQVVNDENEKGFNIKQHAILNGSKENFLGFSRFWSHENLVELAEKIEWTSV